MVLRLPLQKFAKQGLSFRIAGGYVGLIAQECLESSPLLLLLLLLRLQLLQQILRHAKPRPAWHRGR